MRRSVRMWMVLSCATSAGVHAETFQVGDAAECSGNVGTVIRIDPRPGWDEPFVVVEVKGSATTYEFKCVPSETRRVNATAAGSPGAPPAASSAPTAAAGVSCRVGAKLEGQWGISWYEVTVLAAPGDDGKCMVHFDGYGSEWDMGISLDQLRPRGSGDVFRPVDPVADTPAPDAGADGGATTGEIPDGSYSCSKITPGSNQLMHVGTLKVRNGQGTIAGFPEGWTLQGISSRGRNARGELVVAVDYRSAAGFNDRLDCNSP
jgi:hypothetical protein